MKKIIVFLCIMFTFTTMCIMQNGEVDAKKKSKVKKYSYTKTLEKGKKYRLKVKKIKKANWKSSKKSIATVSKKGVVKAKRVGKTKITVKKKNKKYTWKLKVIDKKISAIVFDKTKLSLIPGQSSVLKVSRYYNAKKGAVIWSSSNTNVVSVYKGTLVAKGKGEAVITAKAGKYRDRCSVVVAPITGLGLDRQKVNITMGDSTVLTAYDMATKKQTSKVTWSSDNINIATVSNGRVIAQGVGKTNIRIRDGINEASCEVVVTNEMTKRNVKDFFKGSSGNAQPEIVYASHVQNIGWQSFVRNGQVSGTVGQSRRMEAVKISLNNANGDVKYKTHLAKIGWISEKSNGAISGTTGQGRAIEAVQIWLTGEIANKYDIYYRVHVKDSGWLAWTSNGAIAGTTGGAIRAEALQVQLVPKLSYRVHLQNLGWTGYVSGGNINGTTGQSRRMEAIELRLSEESNLSLSYRTHIQNLGWTGWTSHGISGTTGQGKRMEAIQIKLSGKDAGKYSLFYKVHVQQIGWTNWTQDGMVAGTTGKSLRAEAIQIKLLPKGAEPAGVSYFVPQVKSAKQADIDNSALFLKQQTNYTCTLCSATMMLRRKAYLKNQNYNTITEGAVRRNAWINGTGLKWSFSYGGMNVSHQYLSGTTAQKRAKLIQLLNSHREGIVVYDTTIPHAVLLTDYNEKLGTFYIADPSGKIMGRTALINSSTRGSGQDGKISNFSKIWLITN